MYAVQVRLDKEYGVHNAPATAERQHTLQVDEGYRAHGHDGGEKSQGLKLTAYHNVSGWALRHAAWLHTTHHAAVRDGKTQIQEVALGIENDDWVEIAAGLQEGESVVLNPENNLTTGVRVVPESGGTSVDQRRPRASS